MVAPVVVDLNEALIEVPLPPDPNSLNLMKHSNSEFV
jgi:hypothetical protein